MTIIHLRILVLCVFLFTNTGADSSSDRDKRSTWNPVSYVIDKTSNSIDSMGLGAVNPFKIGSQLTGMAMGGMGLFWGKQENKKCYYHWGLGFSGPGSWNPERWNGAKWDANEEGGLFNAASDAIGVGFTIFFHAWETEEARAQTCKMLGMGYATQQPGFPSKPGTCPQGPDCFGTPGQSLQPQPGQQIPGFPTGTIMIYTIPGQPGEVTKDTPGATMTIISPGQQPMYIPASTTISDQTVTIQNFQQPVQPPTVSTGTGETIYNYYTTEPKQTNPTLGTSDVNYYVQTTQPQLQPSWPQIPIQKSEPTSQTQQSWTTTQTTLQQPWTTSQTTLQQPWTTSQTTLQQPWTTSQTTLQQPWTTSQTTLQQPWTQPQTQPQSQQVTVTLIRNTQGQTILVDDRGTQYCPCSA